MARHIAKNVVANGYAKKCEVQFAYSIGVAKPVSVYIDTFGTNIIPEEDIIDIINKKFDLTPRGIINYLDLQKPIYRQTTNYGHFGKEYLTWERIVKMKNNRNNNKKNFVIFVVLIGLITFLLIRLITLIASDSNIKTDKFENNIFSKEIKDACFPDEVYGVKVYTQLIENGTKARSGTKRNIKYIVIHETDNYSNGSTAKKHADFLSENNTSSTSWHYTVDDKEIYHHIPDNEIANHAGTTEGNKYGIGIELCVNDGGNFSKTLDNAAKLVAYLLKEYDLSIYAVKTHHDFSGKNCPNTILRYGKMSQFEEMIEGYLKQ